jgi:hypothetical protein
MDDRGQNNSLLPTSQFNERFSARVCLVKRRRSSICAAVFFLSLTFFCNAGPMQGCAGAIAMASGTLSSNQTPLAFFHFDKPKLNGGGAGERSGLITQCSSPAPLVGGHKEQA